MEKVSIKTSDNIKIVGNYFKVDQNPIGWVLLLHMMPATKESWNDLSKKLQNVGYESLAIDLRGHGESDLDFTKFTDKEHQKSILDVEAAIEFLKSKGAIVDKICLIGASIGANLSLKYISEHAEFKKATLLSPGLNYRGITTEYMVDKLKQGQKVLFISAGDDGENSAEVRQLFNRVPDGVEKKFEIYKIGGHGTDILMGHPELSDLIINFIK